MEIVIWLTVVGLLVALAVVLFRKRMQIWGAVITLLIVMVLLNWFWSAQLISSTDGDDGGPTPTAPVISGN